jgi:hypothetical protein
LRLAWKLLTAAAAVMALVRVPLAWSDPANSARTWTFEQDPVDAAPAGFSFARTDGGRMGRWVVRAVADAPGRKNALVQADDDSTRDRYPVAVADGPILRDLRVSVRCKPLAGKVDQACGLVFRYRDADNYYVTRANALEDNVRLYYVRDGKRQEFASWSGEVPADDWSELRVEAREDHLVVHWNGQKVIDARDATFADAGKVGLWTKADSVTAFDDLTIAPAE